MALLKLNSTGPDVLRLQRLLKQLVDPSINPDGSFGPVTQAAVIKFQTANKLVTDGVVGPTTLAALEQASQPTKGFNGTITPELLQNGLGVALTVSLTWASALQAAAQEFNIKTRNQVAAWLANLGHESSNFTKLTEDTRYRPERLAEVWPSRYAVRGPSGQLVAGQPNDVARRIGGDPQAVANNVYANRGGNGSEASGDGYRYRGRGPIGLTFKNNYAMCGKALGLNLVDKPDLVLDPVVGARTAGWFWQTNSINVYVDRNDFDGVADMINQGRKTQKIGDANGYADRYNRYLKLLKAM